MHHHGWVEQRLGMKLMQSHKVLHISHRALNRVWTEKDRVLRLSNPQEAVALGLVYSLLPLKVEDKKEAEKALKKAREETLKRLLEKTERRAREEAQKETIQQPGGKAGGDSVPIQSEAEIPILDTAKKFLAEWPLRGKNLYS